MELPLSLHLFIHIFLSLIVGWVVWRIWKKKFLAFFFAVCGGFLVDMDHFIDYYLAFGLHWNWFYFKNGYEFLKAGKIYVLFHAWEYVIILLFLVYLTRSKYLKTIFLGLALGLFIHLWTDVIVDQMPIRSYFLSYRLKNNFDNKNIISAENYVRYLKNKMWVKFE